MQVGFPAFIAALGGGKSVDVDVRTCDGKEIRIDSPQFLMCGEHGIRIEQFHTDIVIMRKRIECIRHDLIHHAAYNAYIMARCQRVECVRCCTCGIEFDELDALFLVRFIK